MIILNGREAASPPGLLETDRAQLNVLILSRGRFCIAVWPLGNRLVKKVEAWDKKGARAIKKGCIEFLNRNGETFDWENDDLSELEVVNEQPKLVDPGVADIPLDDDPNEELGEAPEIKEKPSYMTRAVLSVWGEQSYFFLFSFLCLIWHVIERYG